MTRVNKGIRQEYRVKKYLEKRGYLVTRSAGSHGIFDLVALHKEKKIIRFIQLKYGSKKYLDSKKGFLVDFEHHNYLTYFDYLKLKPGDRLDFDEVTA